MLPPADDWVASDAFRDAVDAGGMVADISAAVGVMPLVWVRCLSETVIIVELDALVLLEIVNLSRRWFSMTTNDL